MTRSGVRSTILMLIVAGTTSSCSPAPGLPCTDDRVCPAGQFCVVDQGPTGAPSVCMSTCDRRSDCPGGQICRLLTYVSAPRTSVCDLGGSLGVGENCRGSGLSDPCAEGLVCHPSACVPGCEVLSPHREDRACPEGWMCGLSSPGVGHCDQVCDPSDASACGWPASGRYCVRFTRPDADREVGLCVRQETFPQYCVDTMQWCASQEVCVMDVCYPSTEAPAIAYPVDPQVPPLVD